MSDHAPPEPVTTLVANSNTYNNRQGYQGQQSQGQRSNQYSQQPRGQQRSGRGRGQGQGQSQHQGQGQRQLNEIKCGYCSGSHFNDDCTIFKSITARRACLAKDNRCDRCLGRGHPRARCFRYRTRFHCLDEGDHHRSLCPKHFPLSDNDPNPNHKSAVLVIQNYGSEDNFSDNLEVNQEANQEEPVEVPVNAAQAYPAQSMGTLLQTADTQCRAPGREDTPYQRTASLLDSCAGRSYITKQKASKLHLKGHRSEILELVTFASDTPHVVKCQIAWLEIKLCDGTTLIIEITIVPFICKAIRKVSVPPAVVHACESFTLSDSVPNNSDYKDIELLIGCDYFWKLFDVKKQELTEGLFLVESKLGWVLTGRVTNTPLVATNPEPVITQQT